MNDIFQETWKYLGIENKNIYKLKKLNTQFKIIFENDEINIPNNLQKTYNIFEKLEPKSSLYLKKFINDTDYKYNISKNNIYRKKQNYIKQKYT